MHVFGFVVEEILGDLAGDTVAEHLHTIPEGRAPPPKAITMKKQCDAALSKTSATIASRLRANEDAKVDNLSLTQVESLKSSDAAGHDAKWMVFDSNRDSGAGGAGIQHRWRAGRSRSTPPSRGDQVDSLQCNTMWRKSWHATTAPSSTWI